MKPQSYLIIFILFAIAVFIIGVRYGQRVEYENKQFRFALSITPVKITVTPPPMDTLIGQSSFSHKDCGISFLYPQILKKESESKTGAKLSTPDSKEGRISFTCNQNKTQYEKDLQVIKIKNKMKFQGKEIDVYTSGDVYSFMLYNNLNSKYILFKIDNRLYSLLEKTLEFSK